jgi:hypothetical protein
MSWSYNLVPEYNVLSSNNWIPSAQWLVRDLDRRILIIDCVENPYYVTEPIFWARPPFGKDGTFEKREAFRIKGGEYSLLQMRRWANTHGIIRYLAMGALMSYGGKEVVALGIQGSREFRA